MTPDPEAIADIMATIELWKRRGLRAWQMYEEITLQPYPGGGWEIVRAVMVRWQRDHDSMEQPQRRRAA